MLVSQIRGVPEQAEPIGADVEHHRQHPRGVDAGGGGVDRELADGDVHATEPPVPDAEDALAVRGHNEIHVLGPATGVTQRLLDLIRSINRKKDAARSPVDMAVALDGLGYHRGVNDGQHFLQMAAEQVVEKHQVAIPKRGQVHVLVEIAGLATVLLVRPGCLIVQRQHLRRQLAD